MCCNMHIIIVQMQMLQLCHAVVVALKASAECKASIFVIALLASLPSD